MTVKIDWYKHYIEARFVQDKATSYWCYKFSDDKKIWWFTKPVWMTRKEALQAWNRQYFDGFQPELDDEKNQALREKEAAAVSKPITFPVEYMPDGLTFHQLTNRYAEDLGRKDLREGHVDATYNICRWLNLTRNRIETRERVQEALELGQRMLSTIQDPEEVQAQQDMLAMYQEYITYTTPFEDRPQPVKKHKTKLKQQTLF